MGEGSYDLGVANQISARAPLPVDIHEPGVFAVRVVDDHGTVAILSTRGAWVTRKAERSTWISRPWVDVTGVVVSAEDSAALDAFAQGRSRSLYFRGDICTDARIVVGY